jgi:Caspase domain
LARRPVESPRPPERRLALVVANSSYYDEGLDRLTSPAQDAAALTRVLGDPAIGAFEVSTVVDGKSGEVIEAVEGFLAEVERSDLLLLYFSCHGLKDEYGRLYFATHNTRRNRLRSTAVSAAVVNDLLLGSRSRRKVLLLDCCYGGAFAKGMQVKADPAVHTAEHFDARGLVVLTASDSTQYAFDGDVLRGSPTPSKFTAVLVDGLSNGEADLDRDGLVTVDDAYDFVRGRLVDESVPQSPRKWEFDVAGHIVLARTEVAGEVGLGAPLPPPPVALAPSAERVPAGSFRLLQPAWLLGSLAVLVSCTASTWLAVTWLFDVLLDSVEAEYIAGLTDVRWSTVGLAAAWAIAYGFLAPPATIRDRVRWEDPWRPLITAYRYLLTPTGVRSFTRGLLSAVPINVLLVAAASLGAGALAYAGSGSEFRDNAFRLVFVMLAIAGIVRYVTWERGRPR